MSELNSPRRARGGWIGGVVLGILLGLVSPYMLAVSPLIFLAPVLTARLYASRGVWAVCASCVVQLAVACVVFGAEFAAIACVLLIVPLIVTLWLLRLGGPSLADALRVSVPVWLLCAALSVALAYLAAGMSLADYVATLVKEQLEAMPTGMTDILLRLLNGQDALSMLDSSPTGYLDAQERARAIESFVTQLRNALALLTPGILLGSSALTAIVATAWPMRVLARGERIEKQRYLPLRAWHLSGSLALFATAAYVASLVISAFSPVSQTLSVGIALQFLSVLAFRVQGVASLERRLGATGMRPGMRGLITAICLLIWPFSSLFVYYGMASALFGPTYGVVTGYMQKRRARKGDGDDDDP